ncbi:uncharacterized protein TNCV_2338891 [Trichonephila clavipes]|nr:uncharacterized protein TNCV_2338891 [Trichonephila clavipes]
MIWRESAPAYRPENIQEKDQYPTCSIMDCLDSEDIQRLVWPARSPDLNPIENVWDALGRQVSGRNYSPTNKNTLIRELTEEWDKLPQQLLDNVVQSMIWYPPGKIDVKSRTLFRALKAQTVLKNEQNVGFRCALHGKHSVTD